MSGHIMLSEGYFISSCSISPPLSTRAAATMFKHASTASLSKPVTSMRTSVVSSVIVVSAPLIIGGSDTTSLLASVMIGKFLNCSKR